MEAADRGKIAQAMYLDQSAVFDCVNAQILDSKLVLYGFARDTRRWFSSYLENRSQYVVIGAAHSSIRSVDTGVPQGSVLGPILYLLFTNEMPENMKEDCPDDCHNEKTNLFGRNCSQCGLMPCFADNSSLVVASKKMEENIEKMRGKLDKVTLFLQSNQLCINERKSKYQNFMVKQKRAKVLPDPPTLILQTWEGEKVLFNQIHSRLLGLNLHQDLGWRSHFYLGTKPLIPALRRRLGQLKHLGSLIPRRGRQHLANGLIVSKLSYMITVWGGAENVHLTKLQSLLNMTARYVMNGGRGWRTMKIMRACNWLSVRELSLYYSLVTLWKVLYLETPIQLSDKFTWTEDRFIQTSIPRLQMTANYWRWRNCENWNNLSEELRHTTRISQFKTGLKKSIIGRRSTQDQ